MIENFSSRLPFSQVHELKTLYGKAKAIPGTTTRAAITAKNAGLVLDGLISSEGCRSQLIRGSRGKDCLVLKLPLDNDEAEWEINAFRSLGTYGPFDIHIIGPVEPISITFTDDRKESIGILMPHLLCPLSAVPLPINTDLLTLVAESLFKSLSFVHTKGLVHGDVKSSNLLLDHGRIFLVDFGSAQTPGQLVATTQVNVPLDCGGDAPIASTKLDWFQALLTLA